MTQQRLFTLFLSCQLALADVQLSELTYVEDESGITITDCSVSASGALVLPSSIDGVSVVAIGDSAFLNCDEITTVTIPEGVLTIGERAFQSCQFESISLPSSLTSLGVAAFYNCTVIEEVALPGGIGTVSSSLFAQADDLHTVTLGEGITSIEDRAFQDTDVSDLTLPASLVSVSDYAFRYSNIDTISIDEGNTSFQWSRGSLMSQDSTVLYYVPATYVGSYEIADEVTEIKVGSFADCSALTALVFGAGLTDVNASMFTECESLATLSVAEGSTSLMISGDLLYTADGASLLMAPRTYLDEVVCLDTVTRIGDSAFYNLDIAAVTLPDGLVSIEQRAFAYCDRLSDAISFPSTLTSLGQEAFFGANQIPAITFNGGHVEIGLGAFHGCYGMSELSFDNAQEEIGQYAFYSCYGLESISFADTITLIDLFAFSICIRLTELDLPASLVTIEESAFEGCFNLDRVALPAALETIGDSAFQGAYGLESVEFAEGGQDLTLGDFAFSENYSLKTITLPSNLVEMNSSCFASSYLLETVVFSGDAPTLVGLGNFDGISDTAKGYKVYAASGFSDTYDGLEIVQISSFYYDMDLWLTSNALHTDQSMYTDVGNDGVLLIEEYYRGLDPYANNESYSPSLVVSDGAASLTYLTGDELVATYVEVSNDLESWVSNGLFEQVVTYLDNGDGTITATCTDYQYMRLKMSVLDPL